MTAVILVIGFAVGVRIAMLMHERRLQKFYEWESAGWREFSPLYWRGIRWVAEMNLESFDQPSFVARLKTPNEPAQGRPE